ncbi:short-chain dehydrogenase/reductase family 16C member 6-like [Oppia nitens]|uniref:short-chain dehydrogenase/reductase family 16C member 6-like n=1 Tax=Oppia nitens TaxID=1686743 RepID=UPI0023DA1A33|nr:short-chain dehydrogenase/reductase family 16C member 6-like [Oppia nitens]
MSAKSANAFIAFLMIFYYWFRGIVLFFVPKPLRFKSIDGQLAVITGGGSGLGRALALRFARRGANIIVWDVNESGLRETVRLVQEDSPGVKVYHQVVDVTDRTKVYQTARDIQQSIGRVDIVVNNAGIVNGRPLMDIPDDRIELTIRVNAVSHFWTVKAFLPDMIERNSGHFVSIASVAGQIGTVKLTDYCASKHAAIGFEESLRMELLSAGLTDIRSTVVLPYFMNTGMFHGFKSSILPALDYELVADSVVSGVLCNDEYVVVPKICYTLNTLKTLMPVRAYYKLYEVMGGYQAMEDFTGRDGLTAADTTAKHTNSNNNSINNNNNNNQRQKVN